MRTHRQHLPVLAAAIVAAALSVACERTPPEPGPRPGRPAPSAGALVTVGGVVITEHDLQLQLKGAGTHTPEPAADQRRTALEAVVREEAAAQRAIALGLDADPVYQEQIRPAAAQFNAVRRRMLAELLYRKEVSQKAAVAEAEARKFYDENTARITTELRVMQILSRDERKIEEAAAEIKAGAPFETVAAKHYADPGAGAVKPWDMGYLRWNLVPDQWREVLYRMKMGETSGVIRGPNRRFWIIHLVDSRTSPDASFDRLKANITEVLRAGKAQKVREELQRDLIGHTRIEYAPAAPAP